MKKNTHPILFTTFIRQKDGTSYTNNWRYFRSLLILEVDQKIWDAFNFKSKNDTLQILNESAIDKKFIASSPNFKRSQQNIKKSKFNFWINN